MPKGIYIRTEEHKKIWFKKGHAPYNWKGGKIRKICQECNKEFYADNYECVIAKYCSTTCHNRWRSKHNIRENCPSWKGGRNKTTDGYVRVHKPEHPFAVASYILEHRLVMEKHLGRYLEKWEVIHYINRKKNDNRLENLQLCSHNHLGPIGNKMFKEIIRLRCLLKKCNIIY